MSKYKDYEFVKKNIIQSDEYKAVFENRNKKYMFGCNNYGEIPGLMNASDGDAWDVFAPGYSYKYLNIGYKYKIKDIIGVLELQNNNHKIAIRVNVGNFDEMQAKKEIKRYVKQYKQGTKKRGRWVAFDQNYDWNLL